MTAWWCNATVKHKELKLTRNFHFGRWNDGKDDFTSVLTGENEKQVGIGVFFVLFVLLFSISLIHLVFSLFFLFCPSETEKTNKQMEHFFYFHFRAEDGKTTLKISYFVSCVLLFINCFFYPFVHKVKNVCVKQIITRLFHLFISNLLNKDGDELIVCPFGSDSICSLADLKETQ